MGFFGKILVDKKVIKHLIEISEGKDKLIGAIAEDLNLQRKRMDVFERETEWAIESLKSQLKELSEPKPKIVNFGTTLETSSSYGPSMFSESKKKVKITEAVIDAIRMSGNELHYKEIFDIIKNYNLVNPNVSLGTVKATLYYFVKRKKIEYGKKPGTFFIKKKKGL